MNEKRKKAVVVFVVAISVILCIYFIKESFKIYSLHDVKNTNDIQLADTEKSKQSDIIDETNTTSKSSTDILLFPLYLK